MRQYQCTYPKGMFFSIKTPSKNPTKCLVKIDKSFCCMRQPLLFTSDIWLWCVWLLESDFVDLYCIFFMSGCSDLKKKVFGWLYPWI